MKDKELAELFENMHKSVRVNGVKKTVEILKKSQSKKDNNLVIINFIIDVVIQDWDGVFRSKNDFLKPNLRGDSVSARSMVLVLIDKCTVLTFKEIQNHLDIPYYTIRRSIYDYKKLDRKNKFDKIIIERHEKLLDKILKFTNK